MNLFSWFGRSEAASPSLATEPAKPSLSAAIKDARAVRFNDSARAPWRPLLAAIKRPFRKRKPRTLNLLMHIRYRGGEERYHRTSIAPELYQQLQDGLIDAENVRSVRFCEEIGFFSKSFAEDYDPERINADLEAFAADVAQWKERRASNPKVAGSTPAVRAKPRQKVSAAQNDPPGKARAKRSRPNQKPAEGEG